MDNDIRILILEDKASDAALMEEELQNADISFKARIVSNGKDYVTGVDEFSPDIVLSDYHLPQYDGVRALHDLRSRRHDTPFILVTGAIGEDQAINIFTNGANDYVMKDHLQRLAPAVLRALEEAREIRARRNAEAELRKAHDELEEQVRKRTAELQVEIEERKKTEESLRAAMARIKTLSGLLRICASCKKIRDEEGAWVNIEAYIRDNSDADFSHGVCPECAARLYPDIFGDKSPK